MSQGVMHYLSQPQDAVSGRNSKPYNLQALVHLNATCERRVDKQGNTRVQWSSMPEP